MVDRIPCGDMGTSKSKERDGLFTGLPVEWEARLLVLAVADDLIMMMMIIRKFKLGKVG